MIVLISGFLTGARLGRVVGYDDAGAIFGLSVSVITVLWWLMA